MAANRGKLWQRCSPVDRMLLALLRGSADEIQGCRLDQPDDWLRVFGTAVRHQVAPLVFERLGEQPAVLATVPAEVVARFHHETMRNMAGKQAMAAALEEVVGWLDDRGIPVMLVKGTSLDRRVFDPPWLTVSGDVDLMLGRRLPEISQEVRGRIWAWNSDRPAIDVHCTPHPDLVMNGILPIDFDGVWRRAVPVNVGNRQAFMMDLPDELLAACINSCRKRYFRLKSLCEMTALVRRHGEDLDWDELARRAVDWQCHWIVYTALFACHAALDLPLPAGLRRRLRVPPVRAAALRWLVLHRSFCTFETLHDRLEVRGKSVGRSLLLCYASHTYRQLWQSLRVLLRQMRTAGT